MRGTKKSAASFDTITASTPTFIATTSCCPCKSHTGKELTPCLSINNFCSSTANAGKIVVCVLTWWLSKERTRLRCLISATPSITNSANTRSLPEYNHSLEVSHTISNNSIVLPASTLSETNAALRLYP